MISIYERIYLIYTIFGFKIINETIFHFIFVDLNPNALLIVNYLFFGFIAFCLDICFLYSFYYLFKIYKIVDSVGGFKLLHVLDDLAFKFNLSVIIAKFADKGVDHDQLLTSVEAVYDPDRPDKLKISVDYEVNAGKKVLQFLAIYSKRKTMENMILLEGPVLQEIQDATSEAEYSYAGAEELSLEVKNIMEGKWNKISINDLDLVGVISKVSNKIECNFTNHFEFESDRWSLYKEYTDCRYTGYKMQEVYNYTRGKEKIYPGSEHCISALRKHIRNAFPPQNKEAAVEAYSFLRLKGYCRLYFVNIINFVIFISYLTIVCFNIKLGVNLAIILNSMIYSLFQILIFLFCNSLCKKSQKNDGLIIEYVYLLTIKAYIRRVKSLFDLNKVRRVMANNEEIGKNEE